MPTKLEMLSAAASPGKLYATTATEDPVDDYVGRLAIVTTDEDGQKYTIDRPRYTLSLDPSYPGWCTDSGHGDYCIDGPNAEFLAELWNLYREGKLVEVAADPTLSPVTDQ